VLEGREFDITDAVRQRILSTTDCSQIEIWVSRALRAKTTAEVFEG
jgi:hypothetical protein